MSRDKIYDIYFKIRRLAMKMEKQEKLLSDLGMLDEWVDIHGEQSFGDTPATAIKKAADSCLFGDSPDNDDDEGMSELTNTQLMQELGHDGDV